MTLSPRIVWEDEFLAVVDKPAGLIVHPAPGNPGPSLVEALGDLPGGGEDPQRPGIVHRLDKDTSGLLIVAREPAAHRALSEMIAAREVSRRYLALVDGCPQSRTGKIDAPLGRDHRSPERVVVGGRRPRPAVTHFEVAERLPREAAARRPAGDRPHPPDPRSPAGDRQSDRRRPAVRLRIGWALRPRPPVPALAGARLRASDGSRTARVRERAPRGPRRCPDPRAGGLIAVRRRFAAPGSTI